MPHEVVVLGAGGMLGHKMFQRLQESFPGTIGMARNSSAVGLIPGEWITGIDAADFAGLAATLRRIRPAFVVNCIGIIKQRPEAQDPAQAITINALLPHRLASLCQEWGGKLIHFSTDCVFSGTRGNYSEQDPCDAGDLYGQTKSLGEVRSGNALTLRTSIIGRELSGQRSLLEWFLAQRGGTVHGFSRVIWSGVTTNHAAWLVSEILRRHAGLCGLYQVAGRPVSKHDLLCMLRRAYSLNVEIVPDGTEVSDRSMCGDRLRRAIGYTAPSWDELTAELAGDATPYESELSR